MNIALILAGTLLILIMALVGLSVLVWNILPKRQDEEL